MRTPVRTAARFSVAIALLLGAAWVSPSLGADTPRRIAVAPFSVVGPEDVRPVAGLLPRLLASRLMAIAGVDAPLVPAGERPPADVAAELDAPLLLRGSVTRLGKGYSIDVDVLDRVSGMSAGVFFVSAAGEDEIIPQVGRLAEDIAAKLFGAMPSVRPAPAAPAPAVPVPPSTPSPAPAPAAGEAPAAVPGSASRLAPPAEWSPATLRRLAQSDKIPDELFGVVATGDGGIVAWGKSTIYLYRVQAGTLLPAGRVTREPDHHFLNVDAADLDGDGVPEILVTDRVNERIESFVLARKGQAYEEIAEKVPYYLAVIPGPDGKRRVVGQSAGIDSPFLGRFLSLEWKGGRFAEGDPLPLDTGMLPLSASGVLGLSAARFGGEYRFVYTEEAGYIRLLDERGKTSWKGKSRFGAASDRFEWGPYLQMEGKRASVLVRQAPRVLPFREGAPTLLVPQLRKAGIVSRIAGGETDGSRLVLLQWDDGELVERAASKPTDFLITGADLVAPALAPGAEVAASVIEQPAGIFKDRISRVVLFAVE